MDDNLQHFGVLGMRWGRRKQRQNSSKESSSKDQKTLLKLQQRKAKAQKIIDDLVEEERAHAKKFKKNFNEAESRRFWEDVFKEDLQNTTIKKYRKEKIKNGAVITAAVLTGIGIVALNAYANRSY